MKLKRFTSRLMAAGLIALPLMSHAAGLGNLSVTSALGQPLAAEIELIAADKAELDSLAATLASDQAFRDARIEYAPVLSTLRFAVVKKPNGKAVLKVTSSRPVNDPFIDMLIELNWASGRLVREYTVLLDPPSVAKKQTVKPVSVTPAQTATAPAPKPAPAPATTTESTTEVIKARPAPAPQDATTPAPAGDYTVAGQTGGPRADTVRVKRGDTLAAIAQRVRPEGIALEQALVGLYRENTNAFAGKNIHRLKAGKTLKVPSTDAFAAIDNSEARREIKLQTADWQAYRQKLADAVAAAPATDSTAPGQAASGTITSKVDDKAAPASPVAKDVLKLSKVTPPAAKDAAAAQALQDKIRAQEEDATAREKALKESSSRVAALEKQVQDMQALVKMQEEAARQAAEKAAQQPTAPAAEPTPAPEPAAEPAVTAPPPAATQPEVPPIVVPPTEKTESAPWYGVLLDNPLYWAAGAALIGLAGLLWWMTSAGRRRKPVTAIDDSIMTGGEIPPNTVIGAAAGGGNINTGDTSFLTDFSQAGLGTIDTHDVDPIAEAEVYMAYGRDAQAEEILKEAILKNPDRHEIRMKLLEIYAARRNTTAFESVAGELYAAVGNKSNSLWDKAAEMGRSIDPTNPLYGDVQASVPHPQPAVPKGESPKVETIAATSAIAGGAMAFDTQAAPTAKAEPEVMDFEPTMPFTPPKVETPAPAHTESSANELDFDLSGLDMPEVSSNDLDLDSSLGSDNKFDFSGLDLDLGDGSNDVELDDVGTKLDLARAYVEMGDKEGAREILNEVIAEGNDKQKTDAKGILVTLA